MDEQGQSSDLQGEQRLKALQNFYFLQQKAVATAVIGILEEIDSLDSVDARSVSSEPLRETPSEERESLDMSDGPGRIKSLARMEPSTFHELVSWLTENTDLAKSKRRRGRLTPDEKVLIFLYITTRAASYRNAAELFNYSLETISTSFHQVLDALCVLCRHTVRIPSFAYSEKRLCDNPEFWPYFKGCLGALDAIYIPITATSNQHPAWRNPKNVVSQNVLAACDFDMNFTYIFAGMEGSTQDSRVFLTAREKDSTFCLPSNCYFLADAGFSSKSRFLLVPYREVSYHPQETQQTVHPPANPRELFNVRHATLRSVIDRTLKLFRRRFRLLRTAREGFSVRTQVNLIFALAAVHNFINQRQGLDLDGDSEGEDDNDETWKTSPIVDDYDGNLMIRKRDIIAKEMWEQSQRSAS